MSTELPPQYQPAEIERALYCLVGIPAALAGQRRRPPERVRRHAPAAQRHRQSSHGARAQSDHPGRPGPVRADAGARGPLAPRHRSRRDRHPERGGAEPAGRGTHPIRPGTRCVRGTRLVSRSRHRPDDSPADARDRLLLRLVPDLLHPGRRALPGGPGGLRPAVREGPDLPGQVHHQLVSPMPDRALQRGGGEGGGRPASSGTSAIHWRAAAIWWSPPPGRRPCWAIPEWRSIRTTPDTGTWWAGRSGCRWPTGSFRWWPTPPSTRRSVPAPSS